MKGFVAFQGITDNLEEKAKALWSIGYEKDKFVLLETVLMLSFLGPQMNSVYNACSWLDFGFTIAESMGIHRSASALGVSTKDKGRVKRLWWTLAVRDAYCATLLGRPFRINIAHCDMPMLDLEDFASESEGQSIDSALYQIHVARLSMIARTIAERRFHSKEVQTNLSDLQRDLRMWKMQIPSELSSASANPQSKIFATSLELLYHQHVILLHFDRAHDRLSSPSLSRSCGTHPLENAVIAAQAISSCATSLVTTHTTNKLPHEVFTGFFMSGIVYYRQIHAPDLLMSQVARASLDNCRMLLHEIRDAWDPAHWSIRIFDFLLSRAQAPARPTLEDGVGQQFDTNGPNTMDASLGELAQNDPILGQSDFSSPSYWPTLDLSIPDSFDDFLLMPNFFIPGA